MTLSSVNQTDRNHYVDLKQFPDFGNALAPKELEGRA
jgi:hypothetical protein